MTGIQIGKSPDFKMTRNKEVLTHSASLVTVSGGVLLERLLFSNFSLAMLCKELREKTICRSTDQVSKSKLKSEGILTLEINPSGKIISIEIIFKLPSELTFRQMTAITSFIDAFF